jgi:hypothetical protein
MLQKGHNDTEPRVAYSTKDENYLANIALFYQLGGLKIY